MGKQQDNKDKTSNQHFVISNQKLFFATLVPKGKRQGGAANTYMCVFINPFLFCS